MTIIKRGHLVGKGQLLSPVPGQIIPGEQYPPLSDQGHFVLSNLQLGKNNNFHDNPDSRGQGVNYDQLGPPPQGVRYNDVGPPPSQGQDVRYDNVGPPINQGPAVGPPPNQGQGVRYDDVGPPYSQRQGPMYDELGPPYGQRQGPMYDDRGPPYGQRRGSYEYDRGPPHGQGQGDSREVKEVPTAWINRLLPATEPMKGFDWQRVFGRIFMLDDHGVFRPLELEQVLTGDTAHYKDLEGLPYNVGEILQQFTTLPLQRIHHYANTGEYLRSLFDEKKLVDVLIHIGNSIFAGHRVALACHSVYFARAFILNQHQRHKLTELHLKNVTAEAFYPVLRFVYTGQLYINGDNVTGLLDVANELEMPAVLFRCLDFMGEMPKEKDDNRQEDPRDRERTETQARRVAESSLRDVSRDEGFLKMSIEAVELALGDDDINIESEMEVYNAAVAWLSYDLGARRMHTERVMRKVRFTCMHPKECIEAAASNDLIKNSPYCRNRVLEAIWLMTLKAYGHADPLQCRCPKPRNRLKGKSGSPPQQGNYPIYQNTGQRAPGDGPYPQGPNQPGQYEASYPQPSQIGRRHNSPYSPYDYENMRTDLDMERARASFSTTKPGYSDSSTGPPSPKTSYSPKPSVYSQRSNQVSFPDQVPPSPGVGRRSSRSSLGGSSGGSSGYRMDKALSKPVSRPARSAISPSSKGPGPQQFDSLTYAVRKSLDFGDSRRRRQDSPPPKEEKEAPKPKVEAPVEKRAPEKEEVPFFKFYSSQFDTCQLEGQVAGVEIGFKTREVNQSQQRAPGGTESEASGKSSRHSSKFTNADDASSQGGGQPTKGDLVAIGGFLEGDTSCGYSQAHKLDLKDNKWSKYCELPDTRLNFAAAFVAGKLYIVGGYDPTPNPTGCECGLQATKTTFCFDPANKTWQRAGSMRSARSFHALCFLEDKLYAMGGQDETEEILNTAESYSPDSKSWSSISAMSVSRVGACAAGFKGHVVVLGGYGEATEDEGPGSCPLLMSVEWFDPKNNKWEKKGDLRIPRAQACLAALKDTLYLAGGATRNMSTGAICSVKDVDRYDANAKQWTQVAPLKMARHNAGSAAIGNKLYVVGGVSTDSGEVLQSLEVYDVSADKWDTSLPELPEGAKSIACVVVPES